MFKKLITFLCVGQILVLVESQADIEVDVSTIEEIRSIIISANNNFNSETFTINLLNDITVDSYPSGQGYDGNAMPFINPQSSLSKIVINGSGHKLSRSILASNEFRFVGVLGSGDLTLKNITLSGGKLSGFHGGAIFVDNNARLTLANVTLSNNMVVRTVGQLNVSGGAIYSRGNTTINDSTIKNNHAVHGGGIFLTDSDVVNISDSNISGNTVLDNGGGIYVLEKSANVFITNTIISDNDTNGFGGGLFSIRSSIFLNRTTVSDNQSGGGIYFSGQTNTPGDYTRHNKLQLQYSTVSGNTGHHAITAKYTSIEFYISTITNNTGGDGIELTNSTIDLSSSIVAGNFNYFTVGNPSNYYLDIDCPQSPFFPVIDNITMAYSLFGDKRIPKQMSISPACIINSSGFGNNIYATLDGDQPTDMQSILAPLADYDCVDKAGSISGKECVNTHALIENSPAIDASNFVFCGNADQRGFPRGQICDMGAYEGFIENETCYVNKAINNNTIVFCL